MLITSSRVLSEKLDVMQLAFFTSPVTCCALLPLAAVREVGGGQGGGLAPWGDWRALWGSFCSAPAPMAMQPETRNLPSKIFAPKDG